MKRITAIVSGRIQNVGYRARVVAIAKEFRITGNVWNVGDGTVKIIAEGEEEDLKRFLDAIRIKNALIGVKDVEVEYSDAIGDYENFYKLVGDGETDERLDKASEYLKELIVAVNSGFAGMKEEMRSGFGEMKEEMRSGFGEMKEEMRSGFGEMKEEISGMREEMRSGFGEMRSGLETISSKQGQTIDEIRYLRGDLKSYMEWKSEKLKNELKEEMRTEFDEMKRVMREHGIVC